MTISCKRFTNVWACDRLVEREGVGEGCEAAAGVPEHNLIRRGKPAPFDLALERVERLARVGRIPNQAGQARCFHLNIELFVCLSVCLSVCFICSCFVLGQVILLSYFRIYLLTYTHTHTPVGSILAP